MDKIKVAKVDDVLCTKSKAQSRGTLHLTAHHLIFKFDGSAEDQDQEMWVPYPLISLVTRLPQTLQGYSPIAFRSRTFETFTLTFSKDSDAADVFESVRELTVTTSVNTLYAFDYQPKPPFDHSDGWNIYNPREEFARMGIGSRTKAWRFTDINKDYSFCPTYPARLVVPARISDAVLTYAAKYRSKARIPALAYLHWSNHASITRSSQPMVGLTNNRSIQDEKLIEAIFQSHLYPDSAFSPTTDPSRTSRGNMVYGATATNLIIDARPTANAMVMSVKGAGTENMEYYKDGKKTYLGVDNIHVMRESLSKVAEALREADSMSSLQGNEVSISDTAIGSFVDRNALRRTGWLKHISAILDGTLIIVRNIHINSSHVLIHCSDGWDRTAQLSSLSQICLDPFYRTTRGFQILVEKDWLSFGHRFADRCGHLSSEKFFLVSSGEGAATTGGGTEAAQAFFASVQNKFTPQSHLKETSPVFHQFLECVRQLQRQFPQRFEFNERFLERLHYHLYSCQFGTFLFNNERQRRMPEAGLPSPIQNTWSVWDYLNTSQESQKFLNPEYEPSLDDRQQRTPDNDMGVLLPDPKDVKFWQELYGRTDDEMNGGLVQSQATGVDVIGPVEGAEGDPLMDSTARPPLPTPTPSPKPERKLSYPLPYQSRVKPPRNQSAASVPQARQDIPSKAAPVEQPEVRPSSGRTESFNATTSSSSAYSLRDSSNYVARSSSPDRGTSTDIRTSVPLRWPTDTTGGMKSIWASFSSNATAALSAVQGAVDGVTKDLRGTSLQGQGSAGGELTEKTSSISTRETWNTYDDSSRAWRSVPSQLPSSVDNPWAIPEEVQPSHNRPHGDGPLPLDADRLLLPSHITSSTDPFLHQPQAHRPQTLPIIHPQSSPSMRSGSHSLSDTSPLSGPQADPLQAEAALLHRSAWAISPEPSTIPSGPKPTSPKTQPTTDSDPRQDPLGVGFLP